MHKQDLSPSRRNRKEASSSGIAPVDIQAGVPRLRSALVGVPAAGTLRLWPRRPLCKRGASLGLGGALLILGAGILACALTATDARAQKASQDLADKLTPVQLAAYEAYRTARDKFEHQLKYYWRRVEAKRDA